MKAYIVSFIDVEDPELYKQYVARAPETIAAYGGSYVARNGNKYALEGDLPDKRVVILEFPSVEKAREWHGSKEYSEVAKIRHKASKGTIFIIEGPEQPIV